MNRIHVTVIAAMAFLMGAGLSAQAQNTPATQIVTDEASGIVRIMVGGEEIVTIDAAGLHVSGNVTYTGMVTDTGAAPAKAPE